ncbi:hypothetical protein TR2A62_2872 [Thalassobium sp. R2A62]|jgi:hypothetical protein|nr:hypothetical protein TR2A62_2872 [Thalassobium sp. R2A62]MDG1339920.1 hypothetical protein [Paracoccaceae bacterium]MDG1801007.1 hypothetical protein [Paracoccaceae bacterium]
MIGPLLIGGGLGLLTIVGMARTGMIAERAAAAVMLIAVALFFPVFAFDAGTIWDQVLHIGIFCVFIIWAVFGFRIGVPVIAAGLIAHGFMDAVFHATHHPAPEWWPMFCAGFDVVAGGGLLLIHRKEKGLL